MKKLALLLALLTLLTALSGCSLVSRAMDALLAPEPVAFEDMKYTRPDPEQMEEALAAAQEAARTSTSVFEIMRRVETFYAHYDSYLTNANLADIHYSIDLTDTYWEAEYQFCMENYPRLDAALEELYVSLANAPLRKQLEKEYFGEGFFDGYEGGSSLSDATLALLEQEAALENRYYTLSDAALAVDPYSEAYFVLHAPAMAELFVELIAVRQQIAAAFGYDSYPQFSYECSFYRDYTPTQAESYLESIGQALVELYRQTNSSTLWDYGYTTCGESMTFDYVKQAAQAMGGEIAQAFELLEQAGLYHIAYGENKYNSGFEVYLWDYSEPFIFLRPYLDQTDKLAFAHEFGHFLNDYVCRGSYAGTDVAEVHSQAFEYLSLCYAPDTQALTQYKMADSLRVYVETAAYALFEHRVYSLTGEDLTVANVEALYREIGLAFGFDSWGWDSRDYVSIPHYFTDPMYMISYVVSNDLAMQFYQMEQAEAGSALALYRQCLTSEDSSLLGFAETYGLESPFAGGRLEAVAQTFQTVLP